MLFSLVAQRFQEIEKIRGRLEMTDILAVLFRMALPGEISDLVYITKGQLLPPYKGIDLGLGERFAEEAISISTGHPKSDIQSYFKKSGDLGLTAEHFVSERKQQSLSSSELELSYVYDIMLKIATSSGTGSQQLKIRYLSDLLNSATPLEARYVVRFVLGQLRLGVGDPTILDALSVSKTGDKSLRNELENAYNLCSDLGFVAKTFKQNPEKIKEFKIEIFKPIRPALAERLKTPEEIIKKLGRCFVEYKYDGFRLMCHKKGKKVEIYSRKLEKMTHMFPDVKEAILSLPHDEIIFEGEALAFNKKENRFYSFQETMHRRRKHGIKEASLKYPLRVFVFDIQYLDGRNTSILPFKQRREIIKEIFPKGILYASDGWIVEKPAKLKKIFEDALSKGLEGVMAKDLSSPYVAGKRKFAWVKLKKSYGAQMDTVDAVILGYYKGKGARATFGFGGLLVGTYNDEKGRFETIAKIGTGFTENEMEMLKEMLDRIKLGHPPHDLDYEIKPDVWVRLLYIVEVAFDGITRSPLHTCGKKTGKGYALRFPRMIRIRDDKGIYDATTTKEIKRMAGG